MVPDEPMGWSTLLGLGIAIAAQVAAGLGLGWLVDSLAHTTPIFLLVGLLLGICGAVGYTIVEFKKYLE